MAEVNGQIGALGAHVETLIEEVKSVHDDVKGIGQKLSTVCETSVAHGEQIKTLFTNQQGLHRWCGRLDARMWAIAGTVVLAVIGGAVKLFWH